MSEQVDAKIYSITNIVNDKVYVGSTTNDRRRWQHHRSELNRNNHNNRHLQSAWNIYREESFVFEILEHCDTDNMICREQWWIDLLDTQNDTKGYNISTTVAVMFGRRHTPESKAKMSAAKKGRTSPRKGKNQSVDARKKMSVAKKGKPLTLEHKAKIGEANRGKPKPEGFGLNMSREVIERRAQTRKESKKGYKTWELISPYGEVLTIYDLATFCRDTGLLQSGFSEVAHGRATKYRGWKCREITVKETKD